MRRLRNGWRAPGSLEPGPLRRAVWSSDQAEAIAAWQELGRQAARDGYARRFLLDVVRGRLALPPESAVPALQELARRLPDLLTGLLHEGDPTCHHPVAIALGRQNRDFRAELLAMAASPDPPLRVAAAAGLAEAASDGALGAADDRGRLLSDPHGGTRWSAACGLGRARGRQATQKALGWLGEAAAGRDERALSGAAFGAVALSPVCPRSARQVLLRLAESGRTGRRAAAAAMCQLPRRGAARLARICTASRADPEARALAAQALGLWAREGSPAACRDLARLAKDDKPVVRAAAVGAIAAVRSSASLRLLTPMVSDRSPLVRTAVAEGLARWEGGETADALRLLATDRTGLVRAAAVRCLGASGAVREACLDREPSVRAAAASTLDPSIASDLDLLLSLSRDRHREVAQAAAQSLCRHVSEVSGPGWQRAVELMTHEATARAAAQGLAAALDRNPVIAVQAFAFWQAGKSAAEVLWWIARAARDPEVSDLARTAARALEASDDELPDALRDLSIGLSQIGRRDLGKACSWLGRCAAASGPEDMASAAAAAPKADLGPGSYPWAARTSLAAAGRLVGQALRARSAVTRERHLARAGAALEASAADATGPLPGLPVRRIACAWRRHLDHLAVQGAPARLRVAVISGPVVAGPAAAALVRIENVGQGPAHDLSVRLESAGQDWRLASLGSGAMAEAEFQLGPVQAGAIAVRGQVQFQDASGPQAVAFSRALEALQPGRLREVSNPYVVGKPLAPESGMFFGRAAEMAFIERALSGGDDGSVVVLVGPRRTGKTSLLKRLEHRLSQWCHPLFVDVQGMLVSGTEAFFGELARRAVSGREPEAMLTDGDSPLWGPAEMVREATDRLDRRVVLLLDEFDDLEEKVRSGLLGPEVFGQLRHLLQHGRNINLVLCGTHRLEELAGEHWSFLLNLATYQRVGSLEAEVAEAVIRVPLGRLGILCEDAAVLRAVGLSGRHPYFLQLLGYRLVERCVGSGEAAVRTDTVEQVAAEVVEQGEIHLRYLWDSAGRQGQPVLRALAAEEAGMTMEELRAASKVGSAALSKAIRTLTACEMVEERSGRYALQIGLLGRWLRRSADGSEGTGWHQPAAPR